MQNLFFHWLLCHLNSLQQCLSLIFLSKLINKHCQANGNFFPMANGNNYVHLNVHSKIFVISTFARVNKYVVLRNGPFLKILQHVLAFFTRFNEKKNWQHAGSVLYCLLFYWLLRRSSKKAKQGHKTIFIGQGLGCSTIGS